MSVLIVPGVSGVWGVWGVSEAGRGRERQRERGGAGSGHSAARTEPEQRSTSWHRWERERERERERGTSATLHQSQSEHSWTPGSWGLERYKLMSEVWGRLWCSQEIAMWWWWRYWPTWDPPTLIRWLNCSYLKTVLQEDFHFKACFYPIYFEDLLQSSGKYSIMAGEFVPVISTYSFIRLAS